MAERVASGTARLFLPNDQCRRWTQIADTVFKQSWVQKTVRPLPCDQRPSTRRDTEWEVTTATQPATSCMSSLKRKRKRSGKLASSPHDQHVRCRSLEQRRLYKVREGPLYTGLGAASGCLWLECLSNCESDAETNRKQGQTTQKAAGE